MTDHQQQQQHPDTITTTSSSLNPNSLPEKNPSRNPPTPPPTRRKKFSKLVYPTLLAVLYLLTRQPYKQPIVYQTGLCHGSTCQTTSSRSESTVWPVTSGWDTSLKSITCRKPPKFLTSNVFCPYSCSGLRSDVGLDEPLYRTEVFWDFGPSGSEGVEERDKLNTTMKRDIDELFPHISLEVAKNFLEIEREMVEKMPDDLKVWRPSKIYVPLFNMCCLTNTEVDRLRVITPKWSSSRSFDLNITFDRVECWRERQASVRTLLIADRFSQRQLRDIYKEAEVELKKEGVPVVIDREDQSPFHAVLSTIHASGDQDLSPYTMRIAEATNSLLRMGDGKAFSTVVTSAPVVSLRKTCHANCPKKTKEKRVSGRPF